MRGEIPEWTGAIQPKLHHNTPEGKREPFLRRPLVEPSKPRTAKGVGATAEVRVRAKRDRERLPIT